MKDVTQIMQTYRECVRNLWNTYFRVEDPVSSDFNAVARFEEIRTLLFSELVLIKLGKHSNTREDERQPWTFLRVMPITTPVPIMVNRPSTDGNKYWDDP